MADPRQNTGQLPAKRDGRDNLRKGGGRPKGVPNKTTIAVKEAILAALDQAGGVGYLVEQADKNPTAFMGLVGKVLPLQVIGDKDNPLSVAVQMIERRVIDANAND